MIKRSLYFGNPCYIRKKDQQLHVETAEKQVHTIPIEDVGIVVLDHQQITITQASMQALLDNNAALLITNMQHLPAGLLLSLQANSTYSENVKYQIEASEPLRKNLWQQTIKAKISNQAMVLKSLDIEHQNMLYWADQVRSGDPDNYEARASAYYWDKLFDNEKVFRRSRFGEAPNNMLNYGYAVLRAVIARSLVGSGLLTLLGIHHRNKYNAHCLADDIMEPFRPLVDRVVIDIFSKNPQAETLTTEIKKQLLSIPAMDIWIEGQSSPLMVGAQRTTASLMKCYSGELRKLLYPEIVLKGKNK